MRLVLSLLVFAVVTFLATWWLRGRGFGEFFGRPPRGPGPR